MRACARVEKRGCAVKVGLGRKTKTVTVDGDVRASAMEPAHEAGGARVLGTESEGRAGEGGCGHTMGSRGRNLPDQRVVRKGAVLKVGRPTCLRGRRRGDGQAGWVGWLGGWLGSRAPKSDLSCGTDEGVCPRSQVRGLACPARGSTPPGGAQAAGSADVVPKNCLCYAVAVIPRSPPAGSRDTGGY